MQKNTEKNFLTIIIIPIGWNKSLLPPIPEMFHYGLYEKNQPSSYVGVG